jgi:hypothetical protein
MLVAAVSPNFIKHSIANHRRETVTKNVTEKIWRRDPY